MQKIVCFILILGANLLVNANTNPRDSLLNRLKMGSAIFQKASIYRNLADLCFETPEEITYLNATAREARKAGHRNILFDALSDVAAAYIKQDRIDSARYFMKIMEQEGEPKEIEDKLIFLDLKIFDVQITSKNNEELLKESLKESGEKYDNPYHRLKQSYITGSALFFTEKPDKAIPYYINALEICKTLPPKERGKFENLLTWQLAHAYVFNNEVPKTIRYTEQLIGFQESYYHTFIKPERPFYNLGSRLIQSYSLLFSCITHLPKEKSDFYLKKLLEYSKGMTLPSDKYTVFLAFHNYYSYHKNYSKAIVMNDSLIKYARMIARYNLPGLYEVQSQIYGLAGNYKEAYNWLRLSIAMKDSLVTEKTNEQLSELEVKHNVDQLTYEKTLLEIKNKRITMIWLSVFLFIFVALSFFLYYGLKKEKKMKAKLRVLNTLAEESENMKTAFINSICHEIRTPLNAITGFSELVLDETIEPEIKKSFPEEIQRNTLLLTNLINDMLEVSNLDSSREKLPIHPEDLNHLCTHVMDKFGKSNQNGIDFRLNPTEEEPVISTHSKYLSLALEHLLDNAVKFTAQGHITLGYRLTGPGQVRIEVEDTGCGIPLEKHQAVFDRFSKLDSFKPGNGLGLYLCKLIIDRLSGKIFIDPEYTSGTRIVILLPV